MRDTRNRGTALEESEALETAQLREEPAARRLEVYVAAHCLTCAEARRLADAAAQRFPRLDVRTIDVDSAPRGTLPALPEAVVAIPTYLLDGAVVAFGNPDPERLFARIAAARPGSPPGGVPGGAPGGAPGGSLNGAPRQGTRRAPG